MGSVFQLRIFYLMGVEIKCGEDSSGGMINVSLFVFFCFLVEIIFSSLRGLKL